MTFRRLLAVALMIAGAAGFTTCLRSVDTGMRDVMKIDGGFCASGGPYVVARQCAGADVRLLMIGLLGGVVATAVYAAGTAAAGQPAALAGFLAWTATFSVLGWNFISRGGHPGTGQDGWLLASALFWLLALGGSISLGSRVADSLRATPDPVPAAREPLVRAAAVPGLPAPAGLMSLRSAEVEAAELRRHAGLAGISLWLATSAAGAAGGIAAGGALVGALR